MKKTEITIIKNVARRTEKYESMQKNEKGVFKNLNELRGKILVDMIEIEDWLNKILSIFYTQGNGMEEFIEESLINIINLNTKLNLFKEIDFFADIKDNKFRFDKKLIEKLRRLNKIRNLFAHVNYLTIKFEKRIEYRLDTTKKYESIKELSKEFNILLKEVEPILSKGYNILYEHYEKPKKIV